MKVLTDEQYRDLKERAKRARQQASDFDALASELERQKAEAKAARKAAKRGGS